MGKLRRCVGAGNRRCDVTFVPVRCTHVRCAKCGPENDRLRGIWNLRKKHEKDRSPAPGGCTYCGEHDCTALSCRRGIVTMRCHVCGCKFPASEHVGIFFCSGACEDAHVLDTNRRRRERASRRDQTLGSAQLLKSPSDDERPGSTTSLSEVPPCAKPVHEGAYA